MHLKIANGARRPDHQTRERLSRRIVIRVSPLRVSGPASVRRDRAGIEILMMHDGE
jgi:hypothetical protein